MLFTTIWERRRPRLSSCWRISHLPLYARCSTMRIPFADPKRRHGRAMPRLSFILVNWNTKGHILEALRSIEDTAYDYRHEIFVVDNGSTDGSPAAIREAFPRVRLIRNEGNTGFARAVNQALAEAKGSYCVLLNSDARLMEGAIKIMAVFMEENPDVGIAGG